MDRFIHNRFDDAHNTFESVRRIADIYEWGNNVLWPGFFADMGPCNERVGLPNTQYTKGCNDDVWPDGEGPFQLDGATPLEMDELVRRMDQLDWTDGVIIRQARSAPQNCAGLHQLGQCYPELEFGVHPSSQTTYGYNVTHPDEEAEIKWRYFSSDELGANPNGQMSAALPSMKTYEMDGFIALAIPFLCVAPTTPECSNAHVVECISRAVLVFSSSFMSSMPLLWRHLAAQSSGLMSNTTLWTTSLIIDFTM
mmetsp:Transcript_32381/g.84942  ORF Transcript_32381/g.84942 Transcript_32381/m.84942 type:complete len:253 (-) Transcript_32381:1912-2670(-)